jgi:hypothetical protein
MLSYISQPSHTTIFIPNPTIVLANRIRIDTSTFHFLLTNAGDLGTVNIITVEARRSQKNAGNNEILYNLPFFSVVSTPFVSLRLVFLFLFPNAGELTAPSLLWDF